MVISLNNSSVMDVLMKSLEISREDNVKEKEVPKEVHGILAVHLKTIKLIETEVDSSMTSLLQTKLIVCGTTKSFSFQQNQSLTDSHTAVCDSVKHFIIELPEECDDQGNNVCIELILSSPLLPGSGSTMGKAMLHIHDIIHNSPISGSCELKDPDTGAVYGHVIADWAFCYGNYGYGESFQLTHSVHKPQDYLHFSLFPRLTPPTNRTDHNGLVQSPHPTTHPIFIPFKETAALSTGVQDSKETLADAPRYTPELLMAKMTRLHQLHEQFKSKADRRQRLKFLKDQLDAGVATTNNQNDAGVTVRKTSLLGRASLV